MTTANFTPDDGSGLDTANAYLALAAADQYHADQGNDYWGGLTDTVKQRAIVRASGYIDKRFGSRFRGTRRRRTQGLMWPRLGAYDNDGFYLDTIPPQILKACAEYAVRAAYYNVLAPDVPRAVPAQDMTTSPAPSTGDIIAGQVRSITKKVGPIETQKSFITNAEIAERWSNSGSSRSAQSSVVNDVFIPEYPEADLWIEQIITSPMNGATMSRGD